MRIKLTEPNQLGFQIVLSSDWSNSGIDAEIRLHWSIIWKPPSAKTHTSLLYGNTNYQQMAMMNSVTKVQKAAFEEANPGPE